MGDSRIFWTNVVRVAAFTIAGRWEASGRLRVWQHVDAATREGVILEVHPLMSGFVARYKNRGAVWRTVAGVVLCGDILRRVAVVVSSALNPAVDVVLVQRELLPWGPPWLEQLCCILGKPIVYDIDDGVFVRHHLVGRWRLLFWDSQRVPKTMALASVTVVGGCELASYAAQYAPEVRLVRTGVPDCLYLNLAEKAENPSVIVGWIGGRGSLAYLLSIVPALETANMISPFTLLVVGGDNVLSADFGRLDVERMVWSEEAEGLALRRLDVGLMPMPIDEWSKYKCAYKILQYMAASVVPVATAYGENLVVIEDGRNGLLVASSDDWVKNVTAAVQHTDRRRCMATQARLDAEDFRASTTGAQLIAALHEARASCDARE